MRTWTFNRGLRPEFVDSLNTLYGEPNNWWKPLVDDGETFVGVRENSMNVYYRGASLLRLKPSGDGGVAAEVHYKYLLRPHAKDDDGSYVSEYVGIGNGGRIKTKELIGMISDEVNVDALKAAARNYADEEKTGVHQIAIQPENAVVDLEVAISSGRVARRIDIAALVDLGDSVALRFFEAKAFANSELRARRPAIPGVVDQIKAYAGLIEDHRDEIERSYRRVCENLCCLEGVDVSGRRGALINKVVDSERLTVDTSPKLVVFGFDMDQRNGKVWGGHLERLTHHVGAEPIARGNPADVRL